MEVIQNPEASADSSSVSVSLSLVGCCGHCLLVALHMYLFLHLQEVGQNSKFSSCDLIYSAGWLFT